MDIQRLTPEVGGFRLRLDYVNSLDVYLSVITIGEIRFGIEKLDKEHQSKKIKMLSSCLDNDLMQRFDGRIIDK